MAHHPHFGFALVATFALVTGCFEDGSTAAPGQEDSSTGDSTTSSSDPDSGDDARESTTDSGAATSTDDGSDDSTSAADEGSTSVGDATTSEGSDATDGSTGEPTTTGVDLGPCPAFSDAFDDGVLDPLWNTPYPEAITEQDGEAIISITAAPGDQFARFMLAPPTGFEGASARVEVGTPPSLPGSQMLLWLARGDGSSSLAFAINITETAEELNVTFDDEGSISSLASIAYVEASHRWLAMREQDGTLFVEASADGVTFAVVAELAVPFDLSDAQVGVVGTNWGALANATEVSARTFELECGG